MCFSTSCLSIGKASGHAPLKDGLHQRPGSEPRRRVRACSLTSSNCRFKRVHQRNMRTVYRSADIAMTTDHPYIGRLPLRDLNTFRNMAAIKLNRPVHHLVGGAVVEGVVEAERLVLQEAGEVHLLFGFVHHHNVFTGNGDHVQVLHGQLCKAAVPSMARSQTLLEPNRAC